MILACKDVSKAFGIDTILEKVTFNLEEKEKAAVVGVNGAGKTTLFKIITGETSKDGGEICRNRLPQTKCGYRRGKNNIRRNGVRF